MHRGDLALLRPADIVAVGEVVTYLHQSIGPVIHRVIARDGERFVFQGDNNRWLDGYRPRQAELLGWLWLHIPRLGRVVALARQPLAFALLSILCLGGVLRAGSHACSGFGGHVTAPGGMASATFQVAAGTRALPLARCVISPSGPATR